MESRTLERYLASKNLGECKVELGRWENAEFYQRVFG